MDERFQEGGTVDVKPVTVVADEDDLRRAVDLRQFTEAEAKAIRRGW